jgi:Spy/CpxP family protein refolding chaperone
MKRFVVPMLLLLGAAPAFASPSQPGQGLQNLGLTPDAQQAVMNTRTRFKDQMKPVWQDARAAHEALRAELQKAQPNDATLSSLEDRLASDRQQMVSLQQQKQAELRKELTPTQYAKLMQVRARFFGRHMHGRHGGFGGQGGANGQNGETGGANGQ